MIIVFKSTAACVSNVCSILQQNSSSKIGAAAMEAESGDKNVKEERIFAVACDESLQRSAVQYLNTALLSYLLSAALSSHPGVCLAIRSSGE